MHNPVVSLKNEYWKSYLRMDAGGAPHQDSGGYGTVNCQGTVGPFEKWIIVPVDGTTVALKNSYFGSYLRLDGEHSTVNCQGSIGPWEKWTIVRDASSVSLKSTQWNSYLRMDAGRTPVYTDPGYGIINCASSVGVYEKWFIVPQFYLTQENLDLFKKTQPTNQKLQALTLSEVVSYASTQSCNWQTLAWDPSQSHIMAQSVMSPCKMAVTNVIIDCIFLALGAVGLMSKLPPTAIAAVSRAVEPVLSEIELIVHGLQSYSLIDQAKAVYKILKCIYTGGCLSAVFGAISNSLTWWDMLLYGITGLATITSLVLTDGALFVAEVVIILGNTGFLIADIIKVKDACK